MDYSVQMLARSEHELMVRSLPKVSDFDDRFAPQLSRWSRLVAGLRALAEHILTSPPNPPHRSRPALTIRNPSPLLRDQLREDSNYELDRLWAASKVTTVEEIRYCLERARCISPDNFETQRALSELAARHADANEPEPVNEHGFAQVSDS